MGGTDLAWKQINQLPRQKGACENLSQVDADAVALHEKALADSFNGFIDFDYIML